MKKFLLIIALLISASALWAYDFSAVCESGQTLYYNITSSTEPYTVEVTSQIRATSINNYTNYSTYPTGDLIIPSSVTYSGRTYSITSIGTNTFYNCSELTSVTIPNNVTNIGGGAFDRCFGLISVTIGNSVTNIGMSAFNYCHSLTSVTIPNSVRSIGDYAFKLCGGLTEITIGNGVTSIEGHSFEYCSNLTKVNYTGTIAQWCKIAFEGLCANPLYYAHNLYINDNLVSDLVIPDTDEEIKQYAFVNAKCLTSVTIPNSVTSIGTDAFTSCSGLTAVYYSGTIAQWCGITFNSNPLANAHNLYVDNNLVTNLVIPNTVTEIKNRAFQGATCLTSVTIPNSVTSIGDRAFTSCSGLTYIFANPTTPPTLEGTNWFRDVNATLLVPCGLVETYQAAEGWNNFSDIRERFAYELNVSSANSQQGTASITQQPNCSGGIAIITAEPATHYNFVSWNDGNTDNPRTITIESDTTFTATFAIDQFTVTVESANETTGTVSGSGTFDYGTETQITATANDNYYFVQWTDGNTDNPRTITVTADTTYTATFAENVATYTITAVSANPSYGTVTGGGTYPEGSVVTLTATANEGYHFVQWNDGDTINPLTITVTADTTYTATFAEDAATYTITAVSANPSQGTVTGGGTYPEGTVVTLTAIANEGYHFVQWNDGDTINPLTITVTADTTYTATFAEVVANYTITAVLANPNYGTVTGGGTYPEGTEITLTATPNEGYEFVQWSDENTDNPRTITVTENAIYIATFAVVTIPTIHNEFSATACDNYTWNEQTYTASGDYTQTFTASNSADSIVTLHLTIYPLSEPVITANGALDACNPSSVMLSAGEYSQYIWSTEESTSSIVVTTPDTYYVEVVDEHGCHGFSEEITIGYSNMLTEAPQIRGVGMSRSGGIVIEWRVESIEGIAGFDIYREDNVANVYTCVKHINRPGVRSCVDPTANPSARAYRYKVCAVDECGGLSPMSEYHKTMHLTINRGIGNNWNLIWSHYEGLEFGTYKIYRGTSLLDMVVIGEVPSTLNSFTDSDNPNCIGFFYQVEVVRNSKSRDGEEEEVSLRSNIVDNGIFPEYTITAVSSNPSQGTVTGGGTYPEGYLVTLTANAFDGYTFVSWSDNSTENPREIIVTGDAMYIATFAPATDISNIALPEISIFPNPTNDILNITSSETISEIEIVNALGQVVLRKEINADNAVCDVNGLTAGIYIVRIHGTDMASITQKKFIKE